jgi:hypothetical protein
MTDDDRARAMAFVDGELPAAERAAFEARLAAEPALADAVAHERRLRASLRAHYDPVLDEPVPAALLERLGPGSRADAPAPAAANDPAGDATPAERANARAWRSRWRWQEWGAMAACLVIGLAVGGRAFAPHAPAGGPALALAADDAGVVHAQGPLRAALESQPGGAPASSATDRALPQIGLSFRDHAQDYCRTFSLGAAGSAGIACKRDGQWTIAALEHAPAAPAPASPGDYRTAASPLDPALLQAVDALREGDTLDARAEADARAHGWQH